MHNLYKKKYKSARRFALYNAKDMWIINKYLFIKYTTTERVAYI